MIIAILIWRPDPVSHWKVAFLGVRNRSNVTPLRWCDIFLSLAGLALGLQLHPQKRCNGSAPSVPTKGRIKNTRRGSTGHTEDLAGDWSRVVTIAPPAPSLLQEGSTLPASRCGCRGCVSAATQGRGDALGQGLLGFADRPSPGHWILVHSDAVSFPC